MGRQRLLNDFVCCCQCPGSPLAVEAVAAIGCFSKKAVAEGVAFASIHREVEEAGVEAFLKEAGDSWEAPKGVGEEEAGP